jgi:cytochrome c oxidase subunit 1
MIPFLYNVWKTWRTAPLVTVDDPWGYGASLEWATSCPPPRHNFDRHAPDPLRTTGLRSARHPLHPDGSEDETTGERAPDLEVLTGVLDRCGSTCPVRCRPWC